MSSHFHRFENYESRLLTPDLSSGKAPVIDGTYMYFCLLRKEAGTGSELHYHPNELLIFPVSGKINAVVGKDRRVVGPGTFVHAPPFARHSMRATEDGPLEYLYIKDRTWTVVGLAAGQVLPDKALTIEEANRMHAAGEKVDRRQAEPGKSPMIVEGLGDCYYPIIDAFDGKPISGRREVWIEGRHLAFGFCDLPAAWHEPEVAVAHESFLYVLHGGMRVEAGGEAKDVGPGDIVQLARGEALKMVAGGKGVRFVRVRATDALQSRIDSMTPEEREAARVNVKAN